MSDARETTAVITGAAVGIGRAIAEKFAAGGTQVAAVDLAPPLETAAAIASRGGRCVALAADVADRAQVGANIEQVFRGHLAGHDALAHAALPESGD